MTSQPSIAGSHETGSRSRRRASSAYGAPSSSSIVAEAPTGKRSARIRASMTGALDRYRGDWYEGTGFEGSSREGPRGDVRQRVHDHARADPARGRRVHGEHNVGAAVILDPEEPGPGIVTERDVVRSLGAGEDPDSETVGNHLTSRATFADGDWSLEEAADAMADGGFRHLVVVEDGELVGHHLDARHHRRLAPEVARGADRDPPDPVDDPRLQRQARPQQRLGDVRRSARRRRPCSRWRGRRRASSRSATSPPSGDVRSASTPGAAGHLGQRRSGRRARGGRAAPRA